MKKLLIFGDSFADRDHLPSDYQWVRLLEKHFKVENYARAGTGPQWSLNLLLERISKIKSNSNLLFIESHPSRVNLQKYKDLQEQANINFDPDEVQKVIIRELLTDEFIDLEHLKFLGAVNALSYKFEKVMYWPLEINKTHSKTKLNHNVTVVSPGLRTISLDEGYRFIRRTGPDTRTNHLNQDHLSSLSQQYLSY